MAYFVNQGLAQPQDRYFIALSTAIQIFLFTPGNASFIENTVSNKIKKESGVKLAVECPGAQIYFYQDPIECRVKTGIFGITVQ